MQKTIYSSIGLNIKWINHKDKPASNYVTANVAIGKKVEYILKHRGY